MQKIALFGKDQVQITAITAQISKEKQQSIITLRHEGQSIQIISSAVASAMIKLALMRTATGMEDPELPLLQRKSSIKLPASEIAAQIKASQSSSKTHQQFRGDCMESGLYGQIAAKKPLLKDTNKKRLARAKKHKQWTLDQCKSALWSGVQIRDLWFQPLCEMRCG